MGGRKTLCPQEAREPPRGGARQDQLCGDRERKRLPGIFEKRPVPVAMCFSPEHSAASAKVPGQGELVGTPSVRLSLAVFSSVGSVPLGNGAACPPVCLPVLWVTTGEGCSPNCDRRFVYFSFQSFYCMCSESLLSEAFRMAMSSSGTDPFIIMEGPSLSLVIFSAPKSASSDLYKATRAFFRWAREWSIFFILLLLTYL